MSSPYENNATNTFVINNYNNLNYSFLALVLFLCVSVIHFREKR